MTAQTLRGRVRTDYMGTVEMEMSVADCITCGVVFAMPQDFVAELRRSHNQFYCPNGHSMVFGKNKLEQDLERAQDDLRYYQRYTSDVEQDLRQERKRHSTTKGQLTKAKRKAKAGQCLKCRRHFSNVERHYETEHGDAEAEWQLDGPPEDVA